MQPRLTIHASPAASSTTTSSAVRPEGNDSVTVRSHVGPLRGRALLIKRLALGAVHEALEHDRTILDSGQSARRDRQVVAHEVEFRDFRLLRKIQLVGVRDTDLAPVDREHLGGFFFLHKNRLPDLRQVRRPLRRRLGRSQSFTL